MGIFGKSGKEVTVEQKIKELEEDLASEKLAKETAEGLLEEQNKELESAKSSTAKVQVITHKKEKYEVRIPKFQGIPGYPGKLFTMKDLKENTTKVVAVGKDGKPSEISLMDYLLEIGSGVISKQD
ncbi:MAG: hypothetical protein JXR07_20570 [Reichenbachiella sp.]